MTRATLFEQPDRPKATQTHGTHLRSDTVRLSLAPSEGRTNTLDDAVPPIWLMVIAGAVCLLTLLIVDTVYPAFLAWMTTGVSS